MAKTVKTFAAIALLSLGFCAFSAAKADRVVACTGVEDREPVGAAEAFPADTAEVTCFSEVTGAAVLGQVEHVWAKDGVEVFRVTLPVRADRWRTWSRKRVSPGAWTVTVLGGEGAALGQAAFTVGD